MSKVRKLIHIVADFTTPGGGREHALGLRYLLKENAEVVCWSETQSPAAHQLGCRIIRPFSGEYPYRGTLVILGPQRRISPWAERSAAERVILVCNASEPAMLYRQLAYLRNTGLPAVELSFVSDRLRRTLCLDGAINISPVIVEAFPEHGSNERPKIGRHSRDILQKHHPEDISLYRQFALKGLDVEIMGGCCLADTLGAFCEGIFLLPFGHTSPAEFLRNIDIFFYRTSNVFADPAPRAVLEALAAGCTVVAATDAGHTDWIKDGENGFLISSTEQAYECILRLANSPETRKKISAAARATAHELSGPKRRAELAAWYLA